MEKYDMNMYIFTKYCFTNIVIILCFFTKNVCEICEIGHEFHTLNHNARHLYVLEIMFRHGPTSVSKNIGKNVRGTGTFSQNTVSQILL